MPKLSVSFTRRVAPALAAAVVLAGLAGPANAATSASVRPATLPTATIYRTIYLAAVSGGSFGDAAAQNPAGIPGNRFINLAAGNYKMGQTLVGPNNETIRDYRQIFLAAGTYEWHCSLAGTGQGHPYNYVTWCWIQPYSFTGAAAETPGVAALMTSGDWSWTGYLTPLFG
jgi:hypothetical protein